jgi:hypothetical protein
MRGLPIECTFYSVSMDNEIFYIMLGSMWFYLGFCAAMHDIDLDRFAFLKSQLSP